LLKIIIGFVLFLAGAGILATGSGAGVLIGGLGLWIMSKMTAADDENFIGCLMVLGAIGAAVIVVQFIWQQISKLLP